jgi:flagellar L-ring protein precursor FlgH
LKTESILRTALCAGLLLLGANGAVQAQSLVDPATFRGPAADQRAHRVGDLLTVLVLEATQARSKAATGSDRKSDLGVSFASPSADFDASLDLRNKTRGEAETTRIGELRGHITVRIVALEDNGLMRIAGAQTLVVNKETQRIQLSGVVRPEDISAQNTLWSSRIADADVQLVGHGAVSEGTRRNIVSRVMSWLGVL